MKYALMMIVLAGCAPSEIPEVEVLGLGPESLDLHSDADNDATIALRYSDGNGDLGGGVARLTDCRGGNVVIELALPPIANDDAVDEQVAIEGEIQLLVNDVIPVAQQGASACADLQDAVVPAEGEISYCVELRDSAGNVSEPDCSPAIAIISDE
jgi:hypothetical protein